MSSTKGMCSPFRISMMIYSAGDEAVVKIMGIDERHFNFMTILIDQTEDGGNPFSTTPCTVRGNLSNL